MQTGFWFSHCRISTRRTPLHDNSIRHGKARWRVLKQGGAPVSVFDEPKIDCHAHVFDPARFPYGADSPYKPSGQELGTAAQFEAVRAAYGVTGALLVQPNSGYGSDNRCMLDAIANGEGRLKGIAIIGFDDDVATLRRYKEQGILGAAFNPTFHGTDYYKVAEPLIRRLADLDMVVQLQVEHDQILMFVPWLERIPVKVLIDHCGRPTPAEGLDQAGFRALLDLSKTGRASVKLSGYPKFSQRPYPFEDAWPFVRALVDAFSLDHCMWASDWPYLRAPERQDYGPLIKLAESLFPDPVGRRKLFLETPRRLFGFAS
jgi:predicted TIM-barrel fold metal-dependent hydrolase